MFIIYFDQYSRSRLSAVTSFYEIIPERNARTAA